MASLMDSVDQRTQLAGRNRMELLLFNLGDKQRYGINVFKVKEVVICPPLTKLPKANPAVRGVAHMRGKTIAVMDLSMAIGGSPVEDEKGSYVIITEYNRSTQGFLVHSVNQIINKNWEEILPPPKGAGLGSYLTAVTRMENDELVEIIDVEKVMSEVMGEMKEVSKHTAEDAQIDSAGIQNVLVVDDSSVARNQVKRTLGQIGYNCTLASNGKEGLDLLRQWSSEGRLEERVALVISDIEMPVMDGYTLTTEIRKDPALADLYIILHTSLSGIFNNAMVEKVGANKFVPKFDAEELAREIVRSIQEIRASHKIAV